MTYLDLIRNADRKLDKGDITLGEYEKMIEPLNREIDHVAGSDRKVSISCGQENDLISRKAAIDAVVDEFKRSPTPAIRAKLRLEALPSAQPEKRWIPCSKRMPEESEWIGTKTFGTTISDEVYVTFESPKGERFTKHLSFQNGKVSSFTQREIDVFYKGAVPIAWMPLPEPYKGGEM